MLTHLRQHTVEYEREKIKRERGTFTGNGGGPHKTKKGAL